MTTAAALTAEFAIAGVLSFDEIGSGLVKALVSIGGVTGELYLQGAQVTRWSPPAAEPVLFANSDSAFAPGRPIRGGIPVIFPWFGPNAHFPAAPQHGLVRAVPWRIASVDRGVSELSIRLEYEADGSPFWPQRFRLIYEVSFGATLGLRLTVENPASRAIAFEQALHTYFAIADIRTVLVTGLGGAAFIDKTDGMRRKRQRASALRLRRETDRIYLDTPGRLAIVDPGRRRITIGKTGAASAVVWNPWSEKAAALGDLGGDLWRRMLCVECGNIADNAVELTADSAHVMHVEIGVEGAP